MSFAYADQTIRVRKLPTGPTRTLRQQFAVARPRRWPYVVIVALAAFALATPVRIPNRAPAGAERTTEAQQLLRLLGR